MFSCAGAGTYSFGISMPINTHTPAGDRRYTSPVSRSSLRLINARVQKAIAILVDFDALWRFAWRFDDQFAREPVRLQRFGNRPAIGEVGAKRFRDVRLHALDGFRHAAV